MKVEYAELDFERFLTQFMPVGVEGDFPASLADDIPPMDRSVLLGTAGNLILEAVVCTIFG